MLYRLLTCARLRLNLQYDAIMNGTLKWFIYLQENHKLRDQNDDLNGQILSLSLYEAKNLFACHTKAQSLAAEIDNASRDEVRTKSTLHYTQPHTLALTGTIKAMHFSWHLPKMFLFIPVNADLKLAILSLYCYNVCSMCNLTVCTSHYVKRNVITVFLKC